MFENIPEPATIYVFLGGIFVLLSAMSNFSNTRLMLSKSSDDTWYNHIKKNLSNPGKKNPLITPACANTTIFRYHLYQLMYGIIGLLVYLAFQVPSFVAQMKSIMNIFPSEFIANLPDIITNAEPLVLAVIVVFILPRLFPFSRIIVRVRRELYERALIPAQQIRETNRLQVADYYPPAEIVEKVREHAIADGFDATDIAYNNDFATTQSLWSKCLILIEQIKLWEADDKYKKSFAALKEPENNERTVVAVKEFQHNLIPDARDYFSQLRAHDGEKSEDLNKQEEEFRNNCEVLLKKIHGMLACVSLQSHFSDHERILKFNELGFKLTAERSGPIPNSNDIFFLTIILCTVLVFPLAYKLGVIKAIMIGAIMFSAVLTPIVLAHFYPKICQRKKAVDDKNKQYIPNIRFPIVSAIFAAALGFIIFSIGGFFLEPTPFCHYTGYERYTNCSYPWGFIHAGIAMILAICMSMGAYPDIQKLEGSQKYRQWGDFRDAFICAFFLLMITLIFVIPGLESLGRDIKDTSQYYSIVSRITIIAFILGFIVPTWYRARSRIDKEERREDHEKREQFTAEINNKKEGVGGILSRS